MRAHWSTVKPAYRVVLADGTQLVCSGDHRFLTERGWKYVTGARLGGLRRRPHLSAGQTLMGTGGFAERPKQTAAYRRGYLCGLIRADGSIGHYSYPRRDRAADRSYLFRLALAEPGSQAGRARAADYLAGAGISCTDFIVAENPTEEPGGVEPGSWLPSTRRRVTAVRTGDPDQARTLQWLLSWPDPARPGLEEGLPGRMFRRAGRLPRSESCGSARPTRR